MWVVEALDFNWPSSSRVLWNLFFSSARFGMLKGGYSVKKWVKIVYNFRV